MHARNAPLEVPSSVGPGHDTWFTVHRREPELAGIGPSSPWVRHFTRSPNRDGWVAPMLRDQRRKRRMTSAPASGRSCVEHREPSRSPARWLCQSRYHPSATECLLAPARPTRRWAPRPQPGHEAKCGSRRPQSAQNDAPERHLARHHEPPISMHLVAIATHLATRQASRWEVARFVGWYKRTRRHSSCEMKPADEFEAVLAARAVEDHTDPGGSTNGLRNASERRSETAAHETPGRSQAQPSIGSPSRFVGKPNPQGASVLVAQIGVPSGR